MPDRKHLTVHPTVFEIVEKEVDRRNRIKEPTGHKATIFSVSNEIILKWKEDSE